jgi:hypothetical protein
MSTVLNLQRLEVETAYLAGVEALSITSCDSSSCNRTAPPPKPGA